MPLLNFKENVDLSDYTLMIPSISVANVPQLTIDILITSLKLKNVATLWHPGLVGSVGSDPFFSNAEAICTACELYANDELKVAAIQFRSTIETKLISKFFNELIETFITLKVNKIYILATGFDYELHNISEKDKFYFLTNTSDSKYIIETTSAKLLERSSDGKLVIHGSGFATKLYEILNDKLKCTMFVKYVSEGENIYDAQIYLQKLFKILGVNENLKISYPTSWRYVYGAPPPIEMF